MKLGNVPLESVRLLHQVQERIRYLLCSPATEKVYVHGVNCFIRWNRQDRKRSLAS